MRHKAATQGLSSQEHAQKQLSIRVGLLGVLIAPVRLGRAGLATPRKAAARAGAALRVERPLPQLCTAWHPRRLLLGQATWQHLSGEQAGGNMTHMRAPPSDAHAQLPALLIRLPLKMQIAP